MFVLSKLFLISLDKFKQLRLFSRFFVFFKNIRSSQYLFFLKTVFYSLLFFVFMLIVHSFTLGMVAYHYLLASLPSLDEHTMSAMPESTRLYDREGKFLYEVHGDVKRRFVPLSEIPLHLQEATISIEDKNFYTHSGYDLVAIARAFYINQRAGEIVQGASTITQQLARTLFLDQNQNYLRKVRELLLAMEIERKYSKAEILEMYLNNIPYGSIAYGISAASEIYFDKTVSELTLLESTYMAALPKAPSDYSPFGTNKEALARRSKAVIWAMHENAYLSDAEAWNILRAGEPVFIDSPVPIEAPHFVFYVLDELEKKYGKKKIREGGFDIYTSLDLSMQKEAEEVIEKWGLLNEEKYGAGNASLVAVEPATGKILSMVGSRNYFKDEDGAFNVAVSPRQPGSSFKPYVYAAAINGGLRPDSFVFDTKTNFKKANYGVDYIPRNYDGKFRGRISIRKALAGSLNIPAVKVLVNTGIDQTIDLAENMGLTTLGDRSRFGPSLALGGGEVKLLEHTAALGAFGNGGRKVPLSPILKITNKDGEIIYGEQDDLGEQVVATNTAYWINDMLSDNSARQYIFGPNSKLYIPGFEVAAKTGTTQDYHDAWTIGYTPSLAVGVWSGNNDNTPMHEGANGYVVASPIWRDFMDMALSRVVKKGFVDPVFEKDNNVAGF